MTGVHASVDRLARLLELVVGYVLSPAIAVDKAFGLAG